MRRPKKSKYKSVVIKKKRYYFYEITWIDPTGDSGHATAHDSLGLLPATMITHAYLLIRIKNTYGHLHLMKKMMSCSQIVMYFREVV